MKTFKKLTAVLLVVMLTLTMCITGFSAAAAEDTYWLAGSEGLTDPVWGGALAVEDYQLAANADGTYSVVVSDVAVGTGYQFKIVKNGSEWIGDATGNNFTFDVVEACDVTITFNPATSEVKYEGAGVTEYQFSLEAAYAVGNGDGEWLNGIAWDPGAAVNKMTETSTGVYEFTMTGVPSYDNYQIKFTDGSWTNSWGIQDQGDLTDSGEACVLGETFDACYNGENIIVALGEYSEDENGDEVTDGKTWTVKCVFDLSAYDNSTKQGGTITITAIDESAPEVPVDPNATYWLAGSEGLTDPVWGGALAVEDYQLTANGDGTYSVVVPDVAVGTGYQFKIVKNGSEWIGDATGNNFTFDVVEACDVTITFNPATSEVKYEGAGVTEYQFSLEAAYAVGNGDGEWLNGIAWDPGAAVNKMTETATGVYEFTMTGVPSYDNYQIKFTDGSWTNSWGIQDQGDLTDSGEACVLGETFDACYNGENIIVKLGEYSEDENGDEVTDGKTWTVKCVFDLSAYDNSTKQGGTITITAVDESAPVEPDATYWLAGSEGLTDPVWGGALAVEDYQLTANGDGTYSVVVPDVAVGTGYQFKIVKNGSEWIGDATGNNFTFDVVEACDVTITFNPATGEAKYEGTGVTEYQFSLEAAYAVGNGDGEWLNGIAWDPGAAVNKMTETATGVYEFTMTGVPSYDNYQIKFTDGSWTNSWGIQDQGDLTDSGEACVLGETFDACYNGENIIVALGEYSEDENGDEVTDGKTWTVKCVFDLSAYDNATKTGGTITITAEEEAAAGTTIKFAAPTVANRSFAWNDVSLYYTSAADISKATLLEMKATDEVYYAPEVGEAASTLLSAGAWTVYSITLTDEQVAEIDAAGKVGFCTANQTANTASRTHFAGTRNVFMAGVDEYLDTYNKTKASVADFDGYTFIIKTTAAGNGANKYYRGNWVSDFTTVKFAAPASNNRESAWDAVELYYGAKYSTSVTVPMVNTKETTKVSDLGDMTTLKVGRWYIYAVSLDAAQTEAVNKSTCVGFQKPGADNKTSASKSILLAKTDVYDGSYNAKARKLQDLEGQVFVVQARSAANQLKTFLGEWQTEAKYTEGKDDTITIYFAAPKGTSATATWSTGVELFYGKTTVYTNTERLAMTKIDKTMAVDVAGTGLTTLVSGDWDVYALTLTAEQISLIDNSNNVGFIKTGSYNRTSILMTKNITRASRLEGETNYASAAETIEAFDGMTFIINGCQDTKNERTSYIGSWVVA